MDDITKPTDRQMSVVIDTANVTFDAPNAMEQDKDIPYIEIKPLSFNTDPDVVDQYQPCKLEDTYQNCTTEKTNYDDEGDKTSQYCTITLKEERKTNLHIEDAKTKEIESLIPTSDLNTADLELEFPASNADNPVPGLMYPGSYYFKDESPMSESKCHDIKIAMRTESRVSDLQTITTRSEHSITYNVKQEKNSSIDPPDLQTISDNEKLVRMSELDLQTTSDEMLLHLDSTSTPQVSTYKMLPCYVKLLRIPGLDLQSQSGVLHFKVEDLHENIKPGCTRKILCESHTVSKPYKCDQCDSRFTLKSSLVRHVQGHTGIKQYKCELCDSRFTKKWNLVTHIQIHTGIKPYKCDHCDSRFTQKSHLVTHIRKHTGIRKHKCELCDSRFAEKCSLLNHVRTHTGSKPYKCPHCDSRFTRKHHLVAHIRTHSGIKPYNCQHCDSRFAEKGSLVKHIRTHTGIKPYICQYCDSRFTQKGSLMRHMRKHTGIKPKGVITVIPDSLRKTVS